MSGAERQDGREDGQGRRRLRLAALALGLAGSGLVAAALWSAAGARAAASPGTTEAQFSSFIGDLPIMPGLAERDEGYAFDLSDGGRLAEARLRGQTDAAVVRGFYAATLTQLGWTASDREPYVYHRAGERLIFLVRPVRLKGRGGGGLEAVFLITPASAAASRASS